ncbi:hypothetical protein Taro_037042 [Colocasia esculenta]|uniref:Uncharacterized protein n=1 Tax=Colocasia esculenta TaxID=4460 RepID=A0A843W340_COLES|nr:hypothetical protein [Colocasia esculenta]
MHRRLPLPPATHQRRTAGGGSGDALISGGYPHPLRWLLLVSALLVMAHAHRGFGLYRSFSLPPLRRCLPLPHFRGSLSLPPLSSFFYLSLYNRYLPLPALRALRRHLHLL